MTLRLDGQTPLLLASTVRDDKAFLSVDLTNVDTGTLPDIPRGTVHLYRSKFLDEGICYEQFRLTNYGLTPVAFSLALEFGPILPTFSKCGARPAIERDTSSRPARKAIKLR
jgi:hypothetical protein